MWTRLHRAFLVPQVTVHMPQYTSHSSHWHKRAGQLDRWERLGFLLGDFGFYLVFVLIFITFALAEGGCTVGRVGAAWFLIWGFRFLSCVCVNFYNFRV